jgi:hypothetical protein
MNAALEGIDLRGVRVVGPETPGADATDGTFPPPDDATDGTDADKLRRIAEAERQVQDARADHAEAAEEAKRLKKRLENRQEDLENLIQLLTAPPESMPLFDGPGGDGDEALPEVPTDGWRSWPLRFLDEFSPLDPKALDALVNAGITTLGDLADYTAAGKELAKVKGMTAARIESIRSACEAFWAANGPDAENEPNPIRDTFATLLSIGHTESQARRLIDRALATGKRFGSVNDLIEAIHGLPPENEPNSNPNPDAA